MIPEYVTPVFGCMAMAMAMTMTEPVIFAEKVLD
jgi:hypothetical protein